MGKGTAVTAGKEAMLPRNWESCDSSLEVYETTITIGLRHKIWRRKQPGPMLTVLGSQLVHARRCVGDESNVEYVIGIH